MPWFNINLNSFFDFYYYNQNVSLEIGVFMHKKTDKNIINQDIQMQLLGACLREPILGDEAHNLIKSFNIFIQDYSSLHITNSFKSMESYKSDGWIEFKIVNRK